MTKDKLIIELKDIGFTYFEHLRKEQRDGKTRLFWTYPVTNHKIWFTVWLLVDDNTLYIEKLINPLGQTFKENQVVDLIKYIRTTLL